MSVSLKSFDVIIGMDWLSPNRAYVLCYEKSTCLNLPNGEALVNYGEKSNTNLHIISCIKAQKYLRKESHAFLAHVVNEKQKVKDLESILKVYNFPDIFPKDLPGVSPERQVQF